MKWNFKKALFLIFLILIFPCAFAADIFNVPLATNGGSGKAHVLSPAEITVSSGKASVKIVWSSSGYDYMVFGGKKYLNENPGGASTFTLPLSLSRAQVESLKSGNPALFSYSIKVTADTTAMGRPHEIEYELVLGGGSKNPQASRLKQKEGQELFSSSSVDFSSLKKNGSLELLYAKEFSVDFYKGASNPAQSSYALAEISGGDRFLLVPAGMEVPRNVPAGTEILKLPLDKTYLVSTSAMDYIVKLGADSSLRFSGTKESGWLIQEAKNAMKSKKLLYAGKYSAPDYELLLSLGCNFALENTMIYHNPEVKEKLEELGIPVLVERSGYEADPRGRIEWIKLYGLLFGKTDEAQRYFDSEIKKIDMVLSKSKAEGGINAEAGKNAKEKKTVAFFFVNSNGAAGIAKDGGYISKMIRLAGGEYIPHGGEDAGEKLQVSSKTIQFESFYALSRNADILIYDGTIDGGISRKADLLKKNPMFSDFKAYKSGEIYCAGRDFFQHGASAADFISDVSKACAGEESGLVFLRKAK